MFTGLITGQGRLVGWAARLDTGRRFSIETEWDDLQQGESIAIDGVCLTVVEIEGCRFYADVSPETLSVTTFAQLKTDARLNLERALKVGDRMGGHFVSGHVDTVCALSAREADGDFIMCAFSGLEANAPLSLISKGSVAINGVSLTINEVFEDGFNVMLIPETLAHTNLGGLELGATVNIEFDMLAKLVLRQVRQLMSGVEAQ